MFTDAGPDTNAARASVKCHEPKPNHRLLVMHSRGIIVAVPLILGGACMSIQQVKLAIRDSVLQQMTVMQSIYAVVPDNDKGRL